MNEAIVIMKLLFMRVLIDHQENITTAFGEDLWYDKNIEVTSHNLHASKRVGVWLLATAFPYITSFSCTLACLSRNCTSPVKYFKPKHFASKPTISTVLRCRDKHPNSLFCDFQYSSWSKLLSMIKSWGNSNYRWTLCQGVHIWNLQRNFLCKILMGIP